MAHETGAMQALSAIEPYFRQFEAGGEQKAVALITLAARHIEGIF